MTEPFEILEHPADLGIRASGRTLRESFENAARGLLYVILESGSVRSSSRRTVRLQGSAAGHLLVRWLSEVLYLYDAERFVPSDFHILEFSDTLLKAEISGEEFDDRRHKRKLDVKAITYHQLRLEEIGGEYQITVYVDI